METDPRVWIAALRSAHGRLADFVAGASPDDLAHPSMCTEWSVAQVLSHLGSGAEINLGTVTGTPVDNEAVWARWNEKGRAEMAASFVDADERLVSTWEGFSDDGLASVQVQLPFLPAPINAAGAVGFRLSEVALHEWDVLGAFDGDATVAPEAAALLVDRLPMMVGMLGHFVPRETRPTDDTMITVTTSEPERHFELELGEGADLSPPGADTQTAGDLDLPAEALLRLTSGRLAPDREHGTTATGALTLDDLRRAFPGF